MRVGKIATEPWRGFENEYYQRYYRLGLRESLPGSRLVNFPPESRLGRKVFRLAAKVPFRKGGEFPPPEAEQSGRYRFLRDGGEVRIVIDAHDSPEITDPGGLEWGDLYFKANCWPDRSYPEKVRPCVNGNGELDRRRIHHLRSLRDTPKEFDLVFISRIWGGIEHNCRLFEALTKLPGPVRLLAVFPIIGGGYGKELAVARRRLEAVGVPCVDSGVSAKELWGLLARSRVVLLRAGKHLCLPWRTLDLLAMGSAVVVEADPRPRWPEPLVEGHHFVSPGLRRPVDTGPAPDADYERLPEVIAGLVADKSLRANLEQAGGEYFDRHASPEAVGRYLLKSISDYEHE